MTQDCADCRFYYPTDSIVGKCRRYAPRPVQWGETETADGNRGETDAVWPVVSSDDTCGEFKPREETP